jgi:hypothetical protein
MFFFKKQAFRYNFIFEFYLGPMRSGLKFDSKSYASIRNIVIR